MGDVRYLYHTMVAGPWGEGTWQLHQHIPQSPCVINSDSNTQTLELVELWVSETILLSWVKDCPSCAKSIISGVSQRSLKFKQWRIEGRKIRTELKQRSKAEDGAEHHGKGCEDSGKVLSTGMGHCWKQ